MAMGASLVKQIFFGLCLLLALPCLIYAEQLPVKIYTTTDGLVSNRISRIRRDSRGFLWFCTEEGLSRFDGYSFTNYTTQQGLPSNWVDDFLETSNGVFFVGTSAGLCVFEPRGIPLSQEQLANQPNVQPMFAVYRPNADDMASRIKVLYEDRAGNIFCGTRRGLYQIEFVNQQPTFRKLDIGMPQEEIENHRIRSLVEDKGGALWIATDCGLYRRSPDGRTQRFTTKNGLPPQSYMEIIVDHEGKRWMCLRGEGRGICEIAPEPDVNGSIVVHQYAKESGLPCEETSTIFESYDGRLWVGTNCGVSEFLKKEGRFRLRIAPKNMIDNRVWSLNEDLDGNLWVGTANGAIRLARNGFTTYREADGLGFRDVYRISENRNGEVQLYTRFDHLNFFTDKFDGERFLSQKVIPRAFTASQFDWVEREFPFQDSHGEWWWPTRSGLYRFARADRVEELFTARPIAHYTTTDGLPSNYLHNIYEDKRGDIWISAGEESKGYLARWERDSGGFLIFSDTAGLPAGNAPTSFCEDNAGNLWVGFEKGGIACYRQGRFTTFTLADGLPAGAIKQLLCDSSGRLWIASDEGGLGRLDNPAAERPEIIRYTTADALASNTVLCIAEERKNCFYVGTIRGLNYLDFNTGSIKRFTTADGLANDEVDTIFRDHRGACWFATSTGVSRLSPQIKLPQSSPAILINEVKIAGELQRISEVGETDLRGFEIAPNRNQLEIGFGSLSFESGETIQYQYKLEGADADWQPPTSQRQVNFANLKPGNYRFLVRALSSPSLMSQKPAALEFHVLAPIWQRWWFLTLAAALLGLAIYSIYRYQLTQRLKVERVRTRIATDLHDDIGANLSLIAMASEVARQHSQQDDRKMAETLSLISSTSRELVDSMGDIVWAVNPNRDHLIDLVKRMRRFASDVFTARGIAFRFEAPSDDQDIRLETETRREVLLIFKEAVNNTARHSDCSQAEAELRAQGGWLMLKLSDNGKGFDPAGSFDGNGLVSLHHRAERLGGSLEVVSRHGEGTTVTLKTPLK